MSMIPRAMKYLELTSLEDWNCDKKQQLISAKIEIDRAIAYYTEHDDTDKKQEARHTHK